MTQANIEPGFVALVAATLGDTTRRPDHFVAFFDILFDMSGQHCYCGAPLPPRSGGPGRERIFCSDGCRQAWGRRKAKFAGIRDSIERRAQPMGNELRRLKADVAVGWNEITRLRQERQYRDDAADEYETGWEHREERQAVDEAMRFKLAHTIARYERNPYAARLDINYRPPTGPLDHSEWSDGQAPRIVADEGPREPEHRVVYATHPTAGTLTLISDGSAWILRCRGMDYGCGAVSKTERTNGYTPSLVTIEAAAKAAASHPDGPQSPPTAPVHHGGEQ
jgi:hypothetical protein